MPRTDTLLCIPHLVAKLPIGTATGQDLVVSRPVIGAHVVQDEQVVCEVYRGQVTDSRVTARQLLFVYGVRFASLLGTGGGSAPIQVGGYGETSDRHPQALSAWFGSDKGLARQAIPALLSASVGIFS